MKKIHFVWILAFSATYFLLSSCKKENLDPAVEASCTGTLMIAQEHKVVTGGSNPISYKKDYKYNSNKKLVKIEYTYAPNLSYTFFDTIIYNGNNVSSVKSYNVSDLINPTLTYNYYYTGSRIDSINDIGTNSNGPYSKMVKFIFTSGVLSAQTVQYISGNPTGGSTDISSIVFTNGNISSATFSSGPATFINETTAPNPFLGLNNTIDILKLYNNNNCSSAYLTSSPTTKIVSLNYTYENGRVKTITDSDGYGGTRVNTFTYVCF